tara:strand:- start:983 stop:1357 length:375 start_codon:yes stop_codon:yes gene_type:complete
MTAAEVLGLYRAMQKSAKRFTNYNVRECVRVVSRHRSSAWSKNPSDSPRQTSTLTLVHIVSTHPHRYALRKVREEFRRNGGLVGVDAQAAVAVAKTERDLIDRQVAVYQMFGDKTPSVIELVKK